MAEWKALFTFHAEFNTADSVPELPATLEMPGYEGGQDRRFPRPHHTRTSQLSSAPQHESSGAADVRRNDAAHNTASQALPLPVHNSITGINYQPSARQHASALLRRRTAVEDMKLHADSADIEVGQLFFIVLTNFEGEMCIGLGRVEEKGEGGKAMKVAWLARPGWSNNPSQKAAFFWEQTPLFRAARTGHRDSGQQITSTEPQAAFLPVPVELTSQSATYDPKLALLHPEQQKNIRIRKQYITTLRAFCAAKWPTLIYTAEQAAADSSGSLLVSEASAALSLQRPKADRETAYEVDNHRDMQTCNNGDEEAAGGKGEGLSEVSDSMEQRESDEDSSKVEQEAARRRKRSRAELNHEADASSSAAAQPSQSGLPQRKRLSTALHR
eukprot:2727783-Pleurochrysis_carterae.AAC.2